MSFGMVEQRKLMINCIKELLIKHCPIDKDKFVAIIMYETGLTKNKSREYVKIFKDMDMLKIDENGEILWIDKSL